MSATSTQWDSYARIADALRVRLELLPPGPPVPSEMVLSGEFGVAQNTVRRALALWPRKVWSHGARPEAGCPHTGSACGDVARLPADRG
jgi:hypothetical protein